MKDTILEAIRFYRKHKDPVLRAERSQMRAQKAGVKTKQDTRTKPDLSQALIKHALADRDQNQCTARNPNGSRCSNRRWLDYHHLKPKQYGGADTLENLVTLCRGHHQLWHNGHVN